MSDITEALLREAFMAGSESADDLDYSEEESFQNWLASRPEAREPHKAALNAMQGVVNDLMEVQERYELLKRAVNENDCECDPECDSYGHTETCKHVDMAASLELAQQRIEAREQREPDVGGALTLQPDGERAILSAMNEIEGAVNVVYARLADLRAASRSPDEAPLIGQLGEWEHRAKRADEAQSPRIGV